MMAVMIGVNGETRVDEAMMDVGKETRQNCRRHGVGCVEGKGAGWMY
jgi:hypothetical protein